jgi:restriction system protein
MPMMSGDTKGSKIAASNACTALYVIGKQMRDGDVIVTPSGRGAFLLARANGPYYFAEGQPLPHRRPVDWLDVEIPKEELTENLRKTLSTPKTIIWLKGYPEEIQASYEEQISSFISGQSSVASSSRRIEETVSFVMEKYLEEFLVKNWDKTVLAESWDFVDSQVQSEVGRLDILAKSKDDQTMLVVELKLNRASDQVLGQVQRYMGWVKSELEPDKEVRGLIIGDQLDSRLEYALSVVDNVSFMRYEMDFRLLAGARS